MGEVVRIGDDIAFKVLSMRGMEVRLGVDAPRHVAVDRAEVAERKRAGINPPPKGVAQE